jgi:signal peptidase II
MKKFLPLIIGIIAAALSVDQISKALVVSYFAHHTTSLKVLPILDVTLVYNRGISFGFFAQDTPWGTIFLVALALIITGIMGFWLKRSTRFLECVSLSLIIGGALGNVMDRIRLGSVIDFIHVHWQHFSFPAFNFADTWITMGAIFMLYDHWIGRKQTHDAP